MNIKALTVILLITVISCGKSDSRADELITTLEQYPLYDQVSTHSGELKSVTTDFPYMPHVSDANVEYCPKIYLKHLYYLDGARFKPYRPVEICSTDGHYLILCPSEHIDTDGRDYIWIDTIVHNSQLD